FDSYIEKCKENIFLEFRYGEVIETEIDNKFVY
ncbi:unnamed protein product, partial [marine sediment metagenome]